MAQQASPRGTFLEIASALRGQVADDPAMTHLPPITDVMRSYDVSRGVVVRAFGVLRKDGVAEPVPGGRWRVLREGDQLDRRPLAERIADIIVRDGLNVGAAFPSAGDLAEEFGVSRPTATKALDKLEAAGVLASGGQGRVRTVRAVPIREERS